MALRCQDLLQVRSHEEAAERLLLFQSIRPGAQPRLEVGIKHGAREPRVPPPLGLPPEDGAGRPEVSDPDLVCDEAVECLGQCDLAEVLPRDRPLDSLLALTGRKRPQLFENGLAQVSVLH